MRPVRSELVRVAVLEIYEQVRREGARADQAMQRVIRREKKLRSVERRAVADAVYGLLRLQGKVDALLDRALATQKLAMAKLATPTQHLLRYAAYLVLGESQGAETAVNFAGPEVASYRWVLDLLQQHSHAAAFGRALLAASARAPLPVAPRSAQVCACHDVSEARIVGQLALVDGDETQRLHQLQASLRCGTECGSCLPALKTFIKRHASLEALTP